MTRICHEHCPRSSGTWLLPIAVLGVAVLIAGAVRVIGQVFATVGKPALVVVAAMVAFSVIALIVMVIRESIAGNLVQAAPARAEAHNDLVPPVHRRPWSRCRYITSDFKPERVPSTTSSTTSLTMPVPVEYSTSEKAGGNHG